MITGNCISHLVGPSSFTNQLISNIIFLGAFASLIGPMEITPGVISQIKSLPVEPSESPGAIHLVYCLEDPCEDGVSLTCMVHQILKEHG